MMAGRQRWITVKDVAYMLSYGTVGAASWLLPARGWLPFCGLLSRVHAALVPMRGAQRALYRQALERLDGAPSADDFRRERLRLSYHEALLLLRHRRAAARMTTAVDGAEHIERALAAGSGAILWVCPSAYASYVAKMALSRAGYSCSHLSQYDYGSPSDSEIGRRVFGALWAGVESRYLRERLVLSPDSQVAPLKALTRRLKQNGVVTITATGSRQPLSVACLGGRLELGQGAPRLSAGTGAALLPAFVLPQDGDRFVLQVQPPLYADDADKREREAALAGGYAERLEGFLRAAPALWNGWMEWRPDA